MSTADKSDEISDAKGCMIAFGGLMAVLLVLCGIGWAWNAITGSDEPQQTSLGSGSRRAAVSGTDDASARFACEHFRNVARDVSDGILTDFEIREKLKEIDNDASVSDNSAVRRAARSMLQDATSGFDMTGSVNAMGAACRGIGI